MILKASHFFFRLNPQSKSGHGAAKDSKGR
jgi:hypothetical protein